MRKIGMKNVVFELGVGKPRCESEVELRVFQLKGVPQYIVQTGFSVGDWYVATHDELMKECGRCMRNGYKDVYKASKSWKMILESMARDLKKK